MEDKITLIFDLDGTICPIKKENEKYEDIVPNAKMIEKMKEYKKMGARIIINTSRNMRTYNGNLGLINANTAKVLLAWLDKWDIPYDEILYGKPWAGHRGIYIDDRAVRPDEFEKYTYEELEEICKKSSQK
ncbi:MAG: capsular biosynthesis protein [Clostridia bacterium]